MNLRRLIFGNFLACCLFTSSCGGGGGGGIVGIDGSGSRVGSVSVTGPINGFGSVIVNGVHYNTDNAKVYIRGELAAERDLDVGEFVVVVGKVDENGQGIAYEVHYQPLLSGEIEKVDLEQNTITVLGQTVVLLGNTTFSDDIIPRNIEGFQAGETVTVSGISDADKNIRASRVERSNYKDLDFVGEIDSLDDTNGNYLVHGMIVDLSGVVTKNTYKVGDWIAVRGERTTDGVFHASYINESMDYRNLSSIESIKMSGFVKDLTDSGQFYLEQVPVKITDATEFAEGTVDRLKNNSNVEVEGALNSDHILVATKVTYVPTPDTQVYGLVSKIVPAPYGSYYLGTVDVQDNTFKIGFGTRLVGDRDRRISFMDLRVGDTVMLSGFYKEDKYVATSLTVDNRVFERYYVEMQGWVGSVMKEFDTFTLFTTYVLTDENTSFSDNGSPITKEECYDMLLLGRQIQVRGYFAGYYLVATRVQVMPWYDPYATYYVKPIAPE